MKDKNYISYFIKGCLGVITLLGLPLAFASDVGPIPDAPYIPNRLTITQYTPEQLMQVKPLRQYSEPSWITEKYVKTGKLPPVEERLPKVPVVMMSDSMPDGIGVYGGVFRHLIGGRPQGWNWSAAQTQGWGGINYTLQQCLTRTGPMYQLKGEQLRVLPNLATDWQWSEDGYQLTMNLLDGAKWSDGHPFTAEDIRFYWEDTVLEKSIPSFSSADALGSGAKLEIIDPTTIRWTFDKPNQQQALYNMAFLTFCPGPAHILKAYHPKYNDKATFETFINAQPTENVPPVTMGPWVPVDIKEDQIIILRRNPYYWKVDEKGQQLPYINEMHFKLGTWTARTLETIAGSTDFSNMENPPIYIETLRKLADPQSPTRATFGPRNLSYAIQMNMNPTLSVKDKREKVIRQLNRDLRFRKAISHAIDRKAVAQGLVQGPFAAEYAGGLHPETSFYNKESVVYYRYNPELSKQYLAELGLIDTDNDGIVNITSGEAKGQNLEIVLSTGNFSIVDNLISMLSEVGVKIIPRPLDSNQNVAERDRGAFDWRIHRGEKELIVPFQRINWLAPISETGPLWHRGTSNDPQQLQPFEVRLVALAKQFVAEADPIKRQQQINEFNRITTENIYHLGLVSYPGALLINKRIKNVPNAPIVAYQWAEDAVMRERIWVAKQDQLSEIRPQQLPEYP